MSSKICKDCHNWTESDPPYYVNEIVYREGPIVIEVQIGNCNILLRNVTASHNRCKHWRKRDEQSSTSYS